MPLPARGEAQQAAAAPSTWSFSGILEALLPGNDQHVSVVSSYAASLAEGTGLTSALNTLVSLADDSALVTSPAAIRAPNSGEVRRRRSSAVGEAAMPAAAPSSSWDEWDPMPTPVAVRPQAAAPPPPSEPAACSPALMAASRRPLVQPLRVTPQHRVAPALSPASGSPGEADLMAQQMQAQLQHLLAEKARLAQENARLQRENQSLHELLAYSHDAGVDECDSDQEAEDQCDAAPTQGEPID